MALFSTLTLVKFSESEFEGGINCDVIAMGSLGAWTVALVILENGGSELIQIIPWARK